MSKDTKLRVLFIALIVVLLLFEFLQIPFTSNALSNQMIQGTISRLLASSVFVVLLVSFEQKKTFTSHSKLSTILIVFIPALLVAINNFPFSAYFSGHASLVEPSSTVWLFLLECFSVGLFEEIIFRGILLIALLRLFPKDLKGAFYAMILSSVTFALTHSLNLLNGAHMFGTVDQILYSFLTGMLFAIVFIKTKNLLYSVMLHSVYNFTGLIFVRLGTLSNHWDQLTILLTVGVSIVVTLWLGYQFIKTDYSEIEELI